MVQRTRAGFVTILVALMALATLASAQNAGSRAQEEARREQWQKIDEIFAAMAVQPGAVVADVGAGGGFFTSRLSRAVGDEGRVYAVDIDADALRRLRARVIEEQLSNVEVIRGADDDPKLPRGTLDAALIVNAYHEMKAHTAILSRLEAALKPGGRLVIVEPMSRARRDSPRDEQTRHHEIGIEFVRQDAREAGFALVRLEDPFARRPDSREEEWMLVLTPVSAETQTAAIWSSRNDAWKASGLRITPEAFKRLAASGDVLVLDVRDPDSYRQGRLPGAVLMTPEELMTPAGVDKLKREWRPIVTYCS